MFHGRCRLARFAIPAHGMVCVLPFIRSCRLLILLIPSHSLTRKKTRVCNINENRITEKKENKLFSRYVRTYAPKQHRFLLLFTFSLQVPAFIEDLW